MTWTVQFPQGCAGYWVYYGNPAHNEITNGGVMLLPESGSIISSAMDPVNEITYSSRIRTFDRTNGKMIRAYSHYSNVPGTLGKSGGT